MKKRSPLPPRSRERLIKRQVSLSNTYYTWIGTPCQTMFERGLFIMSKEHMTEREAEEYGLYYEEALALYQRYRNDPFELLAAAYEMGFLKGKQAKEAVA